MHSVRMKYLYFPKDTFFWEGGGLFCREDNVFGFSQGAFDGFVITKDILKSSVIVMFSDITLVGFVVLDI